LLTHVPLRDRWLFPGKLPKKSVFELDDTTLKIVQNFVHPVALSPDSREVGQGIAPQERP